MKKLFALCVLILLLANCATYHRIRSNTILGKASIRATGFYQEIDYELISGLPIFEVTIEGNAYRFIFDTGGYTVFSEKLLKQLKNIRPVSYIDVKDGNSVTNRINTYLVDQLEIGSVIFADVGMARIGFTESEWFSCLGIDGTLGPNAMKECLWQFDNQTRQLTLTDDREQLHMIQKGISVPLKTDIIYKPSLTYTIGDYTGELGFDTGFNGLLKLQSESAPVRSGEYPSLEMIGARSNAGNSTVRTNMSLVKFDTVSFHDLILIDVITTVYPDASSDLLGSEILETHRVMIDLSDKRLYFKPFETSVDPSNVRSYGLSFDFINGKLVIGTVYQPGPAQNLIPGEEVFRINGRPYVFEDYCDFVEHFQLQETEMLEIEVLRNGQPHRIQLKKEKLFQ
ncbi:MAG: hypothetical protein R2824_27290 [Saprospiraceae bacterium]|nr:hypothetical protein [Lewinella sp.]